MKEKDSQTLCFVSVCFLFLSSLSLNILIFFFDPLIIFSFYLFSACLSVLCLSVFLSVSFVFMFCGVSLSLFSSSLSLVFSLFLLFSYLCMDNKKKTFKTQFAEGAVKAVQEVFNQHVDRQVKFEAKAAAALRRNDRARSHDKKSMPTKLRRNGFAGRRRS